MKECKNCIFSESKNSEFVYCKNFEKNVLAQGKCSKFIINMMINNYDIVYIKK